MSAKRRRISDLYPEAVEAIRPFWRHRASVRTTNASWNCASFTDIESYLGIVLAEHGAFVTHKGARMSRRTIRAVIQAAFDTERWR